MDSIKRIRKQIRRITGKIHKLEQKRQQLLIKEYAMSDNDALIKAFKRIVLNGTYGISVYADTDSIADGMTHRTGD